MTNAPILSFFGAAGTVTGSRFLVETAHARVLVDCGLFQGLKPLRDRNWAPFPVDPASIDAVVLTHAHVDHCGYFPALARDGFRGPVYATEGTLALAGIVLPDSGHLHEEEAAYANRKGYSKHRPALPLFTEDDARASLDHFRLADWHREIEIAPGIAVTMRRAGHILGSSTVTMRLDEHGDRSVLFSGDLGRPRHPVLAPPDPPGAPDVVVIESTYGDREHDDEANAIATLRDAIVRTARRGGVVVIPAFAVDRTEVILHHLRVLMESDEIPRLPIYADSPMALAALSVYREALEAGSPDVLADLFGDDPFDTATLHEVTDVEGSMALADLTAPAIIVSASGMATGGRVVHHLIRWLPDHRATVILVGYQAAGTRGEYLASGARDIKLLGRHVAVRAEVVPLPSFSVHADRSELRDWLAGCEREPDTVYIVHGEERSSLAFANTILDDLGWHAVVPRDLERVRLD